MDDSFSRPLEDKSYPGSETSSKEEVRNYWFLVVPFSGLCGGNFCCAAKFSFAMNVADSSIVVLEQDSDRGEADCCKQIFCSENCAK